VDSEGVEHGCAAGGKHVCRQIQNGQRRSVSALSEDDSKNYGMTPFAPRGSFPSWQRASQSCSIAERRSMVDIFSISAVLMVRIVEHCVGTASRWFLG